MAYQTFPWQQGSSKSFEKLVSLYLPELAGKRVLDVGCNAGFFCGWASHQGAKYVQGIDKNPVWLEQARTWFPECTFKCMDWKDLGPETYDLILCLSAIHYADDQEKLLDLLMSRLSPDGMLVLEIGIAPGEGSRFVETARAVDTRVFPTRAMVEDMLRGYAAKRIGQGVTQAGDPNPRFVYHVTRARPVAVLFMDEHYSGKSSIAASILRPDIPVVNGDAVYTAIASGEMAVDEELESLVRYTGGTTFINSAAVTGDIIGAGKLEALLEVYITRSGGGDFVLDTYIPASSREMAGAFLHARGYFVAEVSLPSGRPEVNWTRTRAMYEHMLAYVDALKEASDIDEEAYLAANPDVAEAVRKGALPNGRYHYWNFGKREKRKLRPS